MFLKSCRATAVASLSFCTCAGILSLCGALVAAAPRLSREFLAPVTALNVPAMTRMLIYVGAHSMYHFVFTVVSQNLSRDLLCSDEQSGVARVKHISITTDFLFLQ